MPEEVKVEQDTTQTEDSQSVVSQSDTQQPSDDAVQKPDTKEDKDGFFKSTIDYIKKSLKSDSGDKTSVSDSDTSDNLIDKDIPDEFSNAAESLGWTGDDITKFATSGKNGKAYTDKELLEMVPELLSFAEEGKQIPPDTKTDKQDKKLEADTQTSDSNKELREQIKKEVIDELGLANVSELQEMIQKTKDEQEFQQQTSLINRANEIFDSASKTTDVFGLTKDLPKYPSGTNKGKYILSSPAFKSRSEVYNDAAAFMNYYGGTIDEAMEKALAAYKGKHLEDDTKRKVVKDLKAQEKYLSGPRTAKLVKKTYESTRDEQIDYVRNLQRAAGVDV